MLGAIPPVILPRCDEPNCQVAMHLAAGAPAETPAYAYAKAARRLRE